MILQGVQYAALAYIGLLKVFLMNTSPLSPKVLVTGASGFIGLHTVSHLLQLGYRVRATVRTEANEKHVREILTKDVNTGLLEFAFSDLLKDEGWQDAVHGCDYIIHTAAPFPVVDPKDENELILPTRDGTLRVLRTAQSEGIRRVVFLSTVGAIIDGHQGENRAFDETDWTDIGKCRLMYHKAKTLAEQAAWDFIHSADNRSKMEMVSINPSSVHGPVLDKHYHTSVEYYRTIMHAEIPGVSRTLLPIVDVRDLVDVLEKAITESAASGRRFICSAATIQLLEFTDVLQQNFSNRGYRIPNRILPDLIISFIGLFSPKVRAVAENLNWNYTLSTEQASLVFGWQPRPYRQTIIDMAESLIKYGLV